MKHHSSVKFFSTVHQAGIVTLKHNGKTARSKGLSTVDLADHTHIPRLLQQLALMLKSEGEGSHQGQLCRPCCIKAQGQTFQQTWVCTQCCMKAQPQCQPSVQQIVCAGSLASRRNSTLHLLHKYWFCTQWVPGLKGMMQLI